MVHFPKGALFALLSLIAAFLFFGCGDDPPKDTVLTGQLTADFPLTQAEIVAVEDDGTEHIFTIDANKRFALTFANSGTYRLFIRESGTQGLSGAVKLVFPRTNGSLGNTIKVQAGYSFDLGQIRYVGQAKDADFTFSNALPKDSDGECEDGIAEDGSFCIDDDAEFACMEEECEDGLSPDGTPCDNDEEENDDDEIECEDGVTPDGAPCEDEDDEEDGWRDIQDNDEIAVPEHNPPGDLAQCLEEDEDENEDDD